MEKSTLEKALQYVRDNASAIRDQALTGDSNARAIVTAFTLYYNQRDSGSAGILIEAVNQYRNDVYELIAAFEREGAES